MRAGRIFAAALALAGPAVPAALAALVALAAPAPASAAAPADPSGFTATPATVTPGEIVTLRATGCAGPATASAPGLFGAVALGAGGGAGQSATVTAGRYARPGAHYDITFGCDGGQGTVPLAVEERAAAMPGTLRTGLGGGVTGPDSLKVVAVGAMVGVTGLAVVRRRRPACA
ncbi:hypothetical protein [Streptomyces sp. IBSBF 2435]|uniref:hypothetical protein n=1 Tax=Streptomyces sp. IBSBF 2435 TaxID=2903531 RepID=UPI002FDBEA0E